MTVSWRFESCNAWDSTSSWRLRYTAFGMWWHTVTHGRGSEVGNWRMEWVASTLHTTSEYGVSSITTADANTSAASSRLNWLPRRFKWTRPFRRKTKSGFCACAIRFRTSYTTVFLNAENPRLIPCGHGDRTGRNFPPRGKEHKPIITRMLLSLGFLSIIYCTTEQSEICSEPLK